jgi:hypothetical protein
MFDGQDTPSDFVAGKTQAFSLSSSDATIPRLDTTDDRGLAELTIVRGPSAGERFIIDIPEVTIGRDPSCGVFLNDRTVSRRHAHLTLRDGRALVEDLGSLNGTWVDGAIVSQGELFNGSTLQVGTFKMIINLH